MTKFLVYHETTRRIAKQSSQRLAVPDHKKMRKLIFQLCTKVFSKDFGV